MLKAPKRASLAFDRLEALTILVEAYVAVGAGVGG
jgi:hypothetical protein